MTETILQMFTWRIGPRLWRRFKLSCGKLRVAMSGFGATTGQNSQSASPLEQQLLNQEKMQLEKIANAIEALPSQQVSVVILGTRQPTLSILARQFPLLIGLDEPLLENRCDILYCKKTSKAASEFGSAKIGK